MKQMWAPCIFLAKKTQEHHEPIQKIAKIVKKDTKELIEKEVQLLSGLKFNLRVYHPMRPYSQLMNTDLRPQLANIPKESLDTFISTSRGFLERSMYSDVIFSFTPSQIALAALSKADERAKTNITLPYIKKKYEDNANYTTLMKALKQIYAIVDHPINNKVQDVEFKELRKKWKACRNPNFNSEETQKRKKQKIDDRTKKRELKNKRIHEKQDAIRKKYTLDPNAALEPAQDDDDFEIKWNPNFKRPRQTNSLHQTDASSISSVHRQLLSRREHAQNFNNFPQQHVPQNVHANDQPQQHIPGNVLNNSVPQQPSAFMYDNVYAPPK